MALCVVGLSQGECEPVLARAAGQGRGPGRSRRGTVTDARVRLPPTKRSPNLSHCRDGSFSFDCIPPLTGWFCGWQWTTHCAASRQRASGGSGAAGPAARDAASSSLQQRSGARTRCVKREIATLLRPALLLGSYGRARLVAGFPRCRNPSCASRTWLCTPPPRSYGLV
jgi:hypothetical protein